MKTEVYIGQTRVGREYFSSPSTWASLVENYYSLKHKIMEKFSQEQIEQFLKIEKETIGSADYIKGSKNGFFGSDEDPDTSLSLFTTMIL